MNRTKKKKSIIIFYHEINYIINRRTLLMYQSFEIFCQNGKSFFFNLYRKENCQQVLDIFNTIRESMPTNDRFDLITENTSEEIKKLIMKLKNKKLIITFIYLN